MLRGYLLVLVPSLKRANDTQDFPVPGPWGSHALGAVLVVLAVLASVALGRRRLPRTAIVAVVAANLALGVLAAGLVEDARKRLANQVVVHGTVLDVATGSAALVSRHGPVSDVFVYTAKGVPLTDVLLFDQDGRPLLAARQHWWPDGCQRIFSPLHAADGGPVAFSYPQRYVLGPEPLDLSGGMAARGQCRATLPHPAVPLPVFGPPSPTPH